MIWIAVGMFIVAYAIGGIFTVREYIWYGDIRYLTLQELGTILLIFFLWPLARAYWRIIH